MVRSRSLHKVRGRTLAAALVAFVTAVAAAPAQTHWTIDPKTSIAWWQMSPHLNHLWATTCPADPSWQPGEGRDEGWQVDYATRPVTRTTSPARRGHGVR